MPSKDPAMRSLAGRVAAAMRWERPDAAELRRELDAARLASVIDDIGPTALIRLLAVLHRASLDDADATDEAEVSR